MLEYDVRPGGARRVRAAINSCIAWGQAHVPRTFIKFLIVGTIGYLVNQITLFIVYDSPVFWFLPEQRTRVDLGLFAHRDVRLLIATIVAVEAAIVSNFLWHERWTFRERDRSASKRWRFAKFNSTSIGSPIISVTTVNILTPMFGISPYLTNTIGIILGMTWNWLWNTFVIWPVKKHKPDRKTDL